MSTVFPGEDLTNSSLTLLGGRFPAHMHSLIHVTKADISGPPSYSSGQKRPLNGPIPKLPGFSAKGTYCTVVSVSGDDLLLSCRQHCTSPMLHMLRRDGRKNTLPVIAVLLLSVGKNTHHLTLATQESSLLHDLPACVDAMECLLT